MKQTIIPTKPHPSIPAFVTCCFNELVLKDKANVVITANAAEKLFPNEDAMGKSVVQKGWKGNKEYFTVTGIIKNIPANTHFKGDVFFPKVGLQETLNFQSYSGTHQYVLLKENADVNKLSNKISKTFTKYNLSPDIGIQFFPVTDIHLRSAGRVLTPTSGHFSGK